MRTGAKILSVFIVCLFLIIPVSAVGDDNPYNAIWFNEELSYNDKIKVYDEYVGTALMRAIYDLHNNRVIYGEHFYDSTLDDYLAGLLSFESLSLDKKFAVYNYINYGSVNATDEQLILAEYISKEQTKWLVSEADILHDIENDCIPEISELPEKTTYDLTAPEIPQPQER